MTLPEKSQNGIKITPIGYVKNNIEKSSFRPESGVDPVTRKEQNRAHYKKVKNSTSELEIAPAYEALLDGIEAFSHIMVIYWPHLLKEEQRSLKKVHPMGRKDLPEQGIFATRSPARPNPVLISSVRLLGKEKNRLNVEGLEALNGSPIIDIKPVTRKNDGVEDPTFPEWIEQIHQDLA